MVIVKIFAARFSTSIAGSPTRAKSKPLTMYISCLVVSLSKHIEHVNCPHMYLKFLFAWAFEIFGSRYICSTYLITAFFSCRDCLYFLCSTHFLKVLFLWHLWNVLLGSVVNYVARISYCKSLTIKANQEAATNSQRGSTKD